MWEFAGGGGLAGVRIFFRGDQLFLMGAKRPPVGRSGHRGSNPHVPTAFSRMSRIYALIHVRVAGPLSFRGAEAALSPIHMANAPCSNPGLGLIDTQ